MKNSKTGFKILDLKNLMQIGKIRIKDQDLEKMQAELEQDLSLLNEALELDSDLDKESLSQASLSQRKTRPDEAIASSREDIVKSFNPKYLEDGLVFVPRDRAEN